MFANTRKGFAALDGRSIPKCFCKSSFERLRSTGAIPARLSVPRRCSRVGAFIARQRPQRMNVTPITTQVSSLVGFHARHLRSGSCRAGHLQLGAIVADNDGNRRVFRSAVDRPANKTPLGVQ
jgi:hypothetical protein